MYLVFPVIVIVTVISAMFTFYFCPKLQDKHCRDHYDYHRENKIQYPSLDCESVNCTENLDPRRNNHFEENSDFKKRIPWLMRIDQNIEADPRKFRCAICEVKCQDRHGFQTHLSGQKHHKKVKL